MMARRRKEIVCRHIGNTAFVDPPPATDAEDYASGIDRNADYELCIECGYSRYHWEQGQSDWRDVPEARTWLLNTAMRLDFPGIEPEVIQSFFNILRLLRELSPERRVRVAKGLVAILGDEGTIT